MGKWNEGNIQFSGWNRLFVNPLQGFNLLFDPADSAIMETAGDVFSLQRIKNVGDFQLIDVGFLFY